ncbi:protease, partial [Corallococcus exercitus]
MPHRPRRTPKRTLSNSAWRETHPIPPPRLLKPPSPGRSPPRQRQPPWPPRLRRTPPA